ncbi:putative inactive receptor kinase [Quercus suber]|uniref:Inactive receptor kinase n=1 Tax=Quercus suber TaxID=58331 RepID=A0AAW0KWQ5_QUESU
MAAVGFDSGSVWLLCFVSLLLLLSGRVHSEPTQDKQALLAFLNQTPHANRVQWNSTDSACNWVGVECDPNRSFVYSVRLPGVGLVGPIPPNTLGRLSQLRVLSLHLCGKPLNNQCSPFFPSPAPSPNPENPAPNPSRKKSNKLSKGAKIAIGVGAGLLALILLVILFLCLKKRHRRRQTAKPPKPPSTTARTVAAEAGTSSSKEDITGGSIEAERNKLVFFDGGVYSFDLEDLLRASAEVLGKGSVGTSYKAVLEEGTTVVVKRLKDVAVSKREFDMQMEVLGKIKHQNVVPLRAFYYSKDEKLLVYDFMAAGSLSALLHVFWSNLDRREGPAVTVMERSRGSGRTPLDWDNRMKIALSTARGLAHLHVSGKVVHGNIKSSNILLRPDQEASVSDFGLNPLFGASTTPNRVAGYRAPEVVETRKVTFKSDVYSFGVLLLELLTGKAPNQASLGEEGIDLPRWVQSVVREEWTAEVFDVELIRYPNIEEEMVQLLQIAMACVSTVPDQRPSMQEVLRMMEDMNRGETDDGLRQSSDDPSKGSEGQTPPPESRTPP